MKTYIALFRGINIGGHHLLPMKNLVAMLQDMGFRQVKAYGQSGNVVFQGGSETAASISKRIGGRIDAEYGFEPYVLILDAKALGKSISGNPYPEAESDPKSLHVYFLASAPKNPDLEKLKAVSRKSEEFCLSGKLFYLHAPEGAGRSKLAASVEGALGVTLTARNWRTVCKIMEMAKEAG
ncbi:MAG: DUF1697 domain-containing protein [Gammaproteobacteria bacterium]